MNYFLLGNKNFIFIFDVQNKNVFVLNRVWNLDFTEADIKLKHFSTSVSEMHLKINAWDNFKRFIKPAVLFSYKHLKVSATFLPCGLYHHEESTHTHTHTHLWVRMESKKNKALLMNTSLYSAATDDVLKSSRGERGATGKTGVLQIEETSRRRVVFPMAVE